MRRDAPKAGLRTGSNTTAHYRAKEIDMTIGLYECGNCGCTNMEEIDVTVCVFHQTREEPGEYDWRCPECGSEDIDLVPEEELCESCEDEYPVKGEALCRPCQVDRACMIMEDR